MLLAMALVAVAAVAALGVYRHDLNAPATASTAAMLVAAPLLPVTSAEPTPAEVEQAWDIAAPLNVRLSGGLALTIQVRAVYSPHSIYFWLRWPDTLRAPPSPTVQQQRATVTWRRGETIGGCAVACHASFSAGQRIDDVQLVAPDVTAAPFTLVLDQWRDGWWTLGYSRPLVTADPVDVQFSDLHSTYRFGLDVAENGDSAHTKGEELILRFAGVPS